MNTTELVIATQTHLDLTEDISLDAWTRVGRDLYHTADKLTWAMADWAEFGDRKFQALQGFCESHGLSYSTIKQAAAVARAVPKSARRDEQLLFGHHFEVSMLQAKQQAKWLALAVENKWSALELRKALRDSQGELSLISDGKPLKLPTKNSTELMHFLTHQPSDFWTDSTREFWRKELDPLVKWYHANLE
jgi:hypothetical protein